MNAPTDFRAHRLTRMLPLVLGLTLIVAAVAIGIRIMKERERIARIKQIQAVREWPETTSLGPTARLRTVCRDATDTSPGRLQYQLTIGPKEPALALLEPPRAAPVPETAEPIPDVGPPGETEFQKFNRQREAFLDRTMRNLALSKVVHSTSNEFVIRFLDAHGFKQIELRVPPESIEVTSEGLLANRTATSVSCGSALLDYPSWTIHAEPYYGGSTY